MSTCASTQINRLPGIEVYSSGREADLYGNSEISAIGGQRKSGHEECAWRKKEFGGDAVDPHDGAVKE